MTCLLLSGCEPNRPLPSSDRLLDQLQGAQLPVEIVEIKGTRVEIHMAYGAEVNRPPTPGAIPDAQTIARVMCDYSQGYSLKLIYADGLYTDIDRHLILGLCDGRITSDEFTAELLYASLKK
jgi:hypothetical protein